MRTVEQIDNQIKELGDKLLNAKGREAEVYTRIVGYYRSVKNWNKGKKEEYNHRECFSDLNTDKQETSVISIETNNSKSENTTNIDKAAKYSYFFRKTCPNCPSVKNYIETINLNGINIDVDTEEGLTAASENNIFGVPTVVFYDNDNNEISRAHTLKDLKDTIKEELAFAV